MTEFQKLRERKSANEKLMFALGVGIDGDIAEMRTLCDKFVEKDELDEVKIELCADKLKTQILKFRHIKNMNDEITKELGE